jgi:hypothetical protein
MAHNAEDNANIKFKIGDIVEYCAYPSTTSHQYLILEAGFYDPKHPAWCYYVLDLRDGAHKYFNKGLEDSSILLG